MNYKQQKKGFGENSNKKPNQSNQPAEVVTGSLHNNGLSKVMIAILLVSLLGIALSAWMSGSQANNLIKNSILVIILDFILMFFVQMNKDKIYFPSFTWWLLASSYLVSILLLCNPYEISLYPFWLLGVVVIAAFIHLNLAFVFCYGLIIIATVISSFELDTIVMNLLLGTFMCMMARSLTKFSQLCYGLVLVCSMNITIVFAMNNFKLEKVLESSLGWWILADVSVLGIVFILRRIFCNTIEVNQQLEFANMIEQDQDQNNEELAKVHEQANKREQAMEQELLNHALCAATDVDASLLVQMKSESEKLYQHSMTIANLSKRAAQFIGANVELAYAGGWYHEIGRLTGKDYVPNGVALIHEYHLPVQIADIIHQHTFKEQLPQTREAVIVMLSDNIISTAQYVKNRMESQITPEKIIENTFAVRMNKGILNEVNMTIAEFTKLKEFYLSVVEELG